MRLACHPSCPYFLPQLFPCLQIRLDSQLQKEIIADLRTPDRIRASLDVVDIVLGFLSSGGVKADKSLGEYIDKVLKMKRRQFSQKVNIHT